MHSSDTFLISQSDNQPQQTTLSKTLLIQSFESDFSQQYKVKVPYDSLMRQLDVGKVLYQIFFQILNPAYEYQVFFFSSVNGCLCYGDIYPFTKRFILGEEFVRKDEVFIVFREMVKVDGMGMRDNVGKETQKSKVEKDGGQKKKRVNDRTIVQTLQKVSLWRSKCEQEKITFQQAAKLVDIPKKTLDDYYALIRTAQQYGFDFQSNYTQKIGVLRQFVKQKQKTYKNTKQKNYNIKASSKGGYTEDIQKQDENQYFETQRKMSIIDKMMLDDNDSDEE